MVDRKPTYKNRVLVTKEADGTQEYVTWEHADSPITEGTPLNKQNLMSDEAAAAVGLTADATPSKAFEAIGARLSGLAADVGKLQTDVGNLKGVSVALNPESWSGGAPYTQTIQVEWMTADWVAGCPTLNVDACHGDVDTIKQRKEEFAKLGMITSSNGALTFTAFEERPWTWLDLDIPRFVKK